MFKKIGIVIVIIGAVIGTEIFALAAMPAFREIATTTNASANFTGYPGSEAAVIGMPLFMVVIAPVIGFAAIVITLMSDRLKRLVGR